jgi:hypothetical protein
MPSVPVRLRSAQRAPSDDKESDTASTPSQPSTPRNHLPDQREVARIHSPTAHLPSNLRMVDLSSTRLPPSPADKQPSAPILTAAASPVRPVASQADSTCNHALTDAISALLVQMQLWEAKTIVLDLLGWGVPPSYLVDCGLQPQLVLRIFNELNLKLPANLEGLDATSPKLESGAPTP